MKYVDVKIKIGLDGNYETQIVGRGEGTSCLSEDDALIIRDIMDPDVFGEAVDYSHTKEYWKEMDELRQSTPKISLNRPLSSFRKEKGKDIEELT